MSLWMARQGIGICSSCFKEKELVPWRTYKDCINGSLWVMEQVPLHHLGQLGENNSREQVQEINIRSNVAEEAPLCLGWGGGWLHRSFCLTDILVLRRKKRIWFFSVWHCRQFLSCECHQRQSGCAVLGQTDRNKICHLWQQKLMVKS